MRFLTNTPHWLPAALLAICLTALLQSAAIAETGRYVRLELPDSSRIINIAEIKVYAGNINIAQSKPAQQSSTFSVAGAAKAVDGNADGTYARGSVAHTSESKNAWWEVDLGQEQNIDKIEIYNRTDCCAERINPAAIRLFDNNRKLKWEAAITNVQNVYSFTLANASNIQANIQTSNLLRNANFAQITNDALPDFWDLHHAAALKFPDLHNQYGVDQTAASPVQGANVLKTVNSELNFANVILMPTKLKAKPAAGNYVFSFYAKASVNNAKLEITPWWPGTTLIKTFTLSTKWQRYSVNMLQTQNGEVLQPIIRMPSRSTYFISAPQLEPGSAATAFNLAADDSTSSVFNTVLKLSNNMAQTVGVFGTQDLINSGLQYPEIPKLSAAFEYNIYTDEAEALLQLTTRTPAIDSVQTSCQNAPQLVIPNMPILKPGEPQNISIPLTNLAPGEYLCNFSAMSQPQTILAQTVLRKAGPNPNMVRVNNLKGLYEVNGESFWMIGIGGIGTWDIPPLWYFHDLKSHGFNTVVMTRQPSDGKNYNFLDIDKFLTYAEDAGLKVILGFAAAGQKPANLNARLNAYTTLVERYKNNPNILAWYPLDEPAANTWSDMDILNIARTVRKLDPYHPVIINWAYDGIPRIAAAQPRGTLLATDVFSFDYYPFMGVNHNLDQFLDYTAKVGLTASVHNISAHNWLQIYGTNDAWREPTGDELEYMAHLSLIFKEMFSYWDTKSNSKSTWDRVAVINAKTEQIAQTLFASSESRQIVRPTLQDGFIYTVWQNGSSTYILTANSKNKENSFKLNVSSILSLNNNSVINFFEGNSINFSDGNILDNFTPYSCKVYKISNTK